MNTLKKIIFGTLLICFAIPSFAGGWTSGGGELLGNSQNPWWIHNTKQVNYCILIDEANFGVSRQVVEEKIVRALSFWKIQLGQAYGYHNGNVEIKFGQQDYILTQDCSNSDLKFQFGVLDSEQFNYLKDPLKYYAVAVRTEYDGYNLKGKGFIYVAPENGPLKTNQAPEKMWSSENGAMLYPTLIHEIGHVLGIKHQDEIFFMREDFLEIQLSKDIFPDVVKTWKKALELNYMEEIGFFKYNGNSNYSKSFACASGSIPSIVAPDQKYRLKIPQYEKYNKFFGFKETDCGLISIENDTLKGNIWDLKTGKKYTIGEGKLEVIENDSYNDRQTLASIKAEKNKTFLGSTYGRVDLASMQKNIYAKVKYKIFETNQVRDLGITISYGTVQNYSGVLDGEFLLNIEAGK
jgi:hypothetical protein